MNGSSASGSGKGKKKKGSQRPVSAKKPDGSEDAPMDGVEEAGDDENNEEEAGDEEGEEEGGEEGEEEGEEEESIKPPPANTANQGKQVAKAPVPAPNKGDKVNPSAPAGPPTKKK